MFNNFNQLYKKYRSSKTLQTGLWIMGAFILLGLVWVVGGVGSQPSDPLVQGSTLNDDTGKMLMDAFIKLMIVLVLIYVVFLVLRKWQTGKVVAHKRRLSIAETLRLSPRQSICLVRVGSRELLVGVTDQTMSLLSEVDPEDIDTEPAEEAPMAMSFGDAFQQSLSSALHMNGRGKKGE
jgi:flagellar biosynthetic protein FliO